MKLTQRQRWIVRAAVFGELDAWQAWSQQVDFEQLEAGEFRLLPLLYQALKAQGVEHPLMGRLKGIYRQSWTRNQLSLRRLADLLQHFNEAGIPTLVFKGASLALRTYSNLALRPMADADVLIPFERLEDALACLSRLAWHPTQYSSDDLSPALLQYVHALGFVQRQTQQEFDLSWRVFHHDLRAGQDDDFWAQSVSFSVFDVATQALCHSDEFSAVCVHGMYWEMNANLRWIADAIQLLHQAPIDWQRVLFIAERHQAAQALYEALSLLRTELDADIPENVLHQLAHLPTPRPARWYYALEKQTSYGRSPLVNLTRRYLQYHLSARPTSFPRYLMLLWGVRSYADFIKMAWHKFRQPGQQTP